MWVLMNFKFVCCVQALFCVVCFLFCAVCGFLNKILACADCPSVAAFSKMSKSVFILSLMGRVVAQRAQPMDGVVKIRMCSQIKVSVFAVTVRTMCPKIHPKA